jgi:hypothetical protein
MQKQKRTGVEAMKSETKTLSVPFDTPKSLFRNILHITPLNPKIWTVLAGNSMIPQDQGEGGYPIPTS